ncbi:MAG: diguanylate cyclase [Planctomycetota bacterium]
MEARRHDGRSERPRSPRDAALRAIAVSSLLVLAIDLWLPSGVVLGSLYILPVFASAWLASPRFTNVVAWSCSVAAVLGATIGIASGPGATPLGIGVQLAQALFVILVANRLAHLRIASERGLERSRELVATALRSIADAVVTSDREERVTLVNGPAERLLGWSSDSADGRPIAEVVRLEPDPETDAPSDPRAPRRQVLVARDGTRAPVEVTSSPIRSPRGEELGRVLVLRDARDLVAYEARMRDLAYRDGLTGLANRRSLDERLDLELAHARRSGKRLGLLFIDLDRFKQINDTLGHRAGDQLLVAVAQRLSACLREADTVARIAGDEFTVLVPELGSKDDVAGVAAKILDAMVRPVVLEGTATPISPSIGAAVFPDDAASAEELVRRADLAMYRAKSLGGAGYAVHEGEAARWTPRTHDTGANGKASRHGSTRGEGTRA